jgi:alkylation response protein AidB-like acyl-CoA dehydrogenase
MADYYLDQRDIRFNLFEMLELGDKLLASQKYGELEVDDINMVLDEAIKFAKDVLAPTNEVGDREGCTLADGVVSMPKPFHEAYRLYCENGWMGINAKEEWGGAGMPDIMWCVINDIMFAANMSLNLCNLLTPGAARIFEASGSDAIRKTYLENMYTGKWTGTMCLTEPQAGSDVGAVATKARKEGDRYFIEGDKIFITYGEHDLAENIVHAVLARTEGAPKGTKGLSLFLVPKFLPKEDGSLGARNDVVCARRSSTRWASTARLPVRCPLAPTRTASAGSIGEEGRGMPDHVSADERGADLGRSCRARRLASAAYLHGAQLQRASASRARPFKATSKIPTASETITQRTQTWR